MAVMVVIVVIVELGEMSWPMRLHKQHKESSK